MVPPFLSSPQPPQWLNHLLHNPSPVLKHQCELLFGVRPCIFDFQLCLMYQSTTGAHS